jgi:hypothetical protein
LANAVNVFIELLGKHVYTLPYDTTTIMSATSPENSTVHIIVHGRMALFDKVKDLLAMKGFDAQKMRLASLEEAGKSGEYVAMLWPPWDPKEIILSEITKLDESSDHKQPATSMAMGAWSQVGQKEISRIVI